MSDLSRETIDLPVPDSSAMRVHLARPDGAGPHPAVLVLHELFGVNDDILAVLGELAGRGFVAAAPELYHRGFEPGRSLPRDDAGRAAGFEQLNALTRDAVVADVRTALDHLSSRPEVNGAPTLMGFSMGGHAAYLAATALPVRRTVVLYAGWLTGTDIPLSRPEPTYDLTSGITGEVVMIVGAADPLVDAATREALAARLAEAGVPHELVVLPGVEHAFFWPGTPAYDADAVAESWRRIEAFLRP